MPVQCRAVVDVPSSGGSSTVKEPGHFEVRKSSSQVSRVDFFPQHFYFLFTLLPKQSRARQGRARAWARAVDLPARSLAPPPFLLFIGTWDVEQIGLELSVESVQYHISTSDVFRQSYACGHTAVAGACGKVVRKRVADLRTDNGSDTASVCGRGELQLQLSVTVTCNWWMNLLRMWLNYRNTDWSSAVPSIVVHSIPDHSWCSVHGRHTTGVQGDESRWWNTALQRLQLIRFRRLHCHQHQRPTCRLPVWHRSRYDFRFCAIFCFIIMDLLSAVFRPEVVGSDRTWV